MEKHTHSAAPCCLKVEYKSNPLGMDEKCPRFEYRLSGNACQTARQIVVKEQDGKIVWDSKWTDDDKTLQITYAGEELKPFTRYTWQVRIKDGNNKPGPWSNGKDFFETGFLGTGWQDSQWIFHKRQWHGPGLPPQLFLKDFELPATPIASARLYATALGCYEAQLNGKPVTQDIFNPGWTAYSSRVQYQAYDVTGLLRKGANSLEVTLADGWYSGRIAQLSDYTGREAKFRCELHIRFADGSVKRLGSDSSFRCALAGGPIRMSDLYDGETVELWRDAHWLRKESAFTAAECVSVPVSIQWHSGAPVRRLQIRPAEKLIRRQNGNLLVDFGQNLAGRERITISGACRGDTITVAHGEMLNPDSSLYTENLRTAKAVSTYVCDDAASCILEPRFACYGFRYLEISGLRGTPSPEDICAVVISSDLPRTGLFSCSEPLLNKLFENTGWSMRANFLDVPTDCPQRDERLGWTADAQLFCNTASYNARVPEFFTKWLKDLELDRQKCGCYPEISPLPGGIDSTSYRPICGWSDAGIIVPWTMYRKYGDRRIMEEHFDGMMAYIRLCVRDVIDNSVTEGYCCRYDDWLNLDDPTSHQLLATAYLAGMLDIMLQAAEVLGRNDLLPWLQATSATVRKTFVDKFVDAKDGLVERSQCALLMALHWNLLPEKHIAGAVSALEDVIRNKHKLHIATGFLGTPLMLPVLSRFGLHQLAGELLMQKSMPGWLYPVTQGATTIWERWNSYSHRHGFADAAMNSFNHYAYGSVVEWFYEYLGGIRDARDGFKSFTLQPMPIKELKFCETVFCSPYGPISSCWKRTAKKISWEFTVPANTVARIIPPGRELLFLEGTGEIREDANGYLAGPGEYQAESLL